MNQHLPKWHNRPLHLTKHQIQDPVTVIREFTWEYSIIEVREMLWELLIDALQNENHNAGKSIIFYDSLIKTLEALYINFPPKSLTQNKVL
ncbi:MAG TPA: hypothetical protein VM802_08330 [Chitinophaga sp.]|uniref:hypothetical protein n=1 Tax=Chitinophaga sp. TaxID=1869181 RepID=UPI002CEE0120|nr:hypothetical protein [Chitinophaga sp.]HVI44863.1 hypothetical protein [Chitinophaga sp.]